MAEHHHIGRGTGEDVPQIVQVVPADMDADVTDADATDADATDVDATDDELIERKHSENHSPSNTGTNYMEQLASSTSASVLEAGVNVGMSLIQNLKTPLEEAKRCGHTEASHWLRCMEQLEGDTKPPRTVVGVIGNTGAGKSSVINAVLDEERLVPTSGMRACTASATEISYNHSNDPEKLYRAEIEFITAQDWYKELKTLLGDIVDGSGNLCRDTSDPDSEAGLAYSRIKAVYPTKTKDQIARSDPFTLTQEPMVYQLLGTIKQVNATNSPDLYKTLQHYVDSTEKNTKAQMEYWPLVKVVRIYCKSPALSTGVVIVDLPGVQDSNSARAAVADNYMKACSSLWITAAIQRAVDDKTAKNLLGDSFKRQLQYDGTYSAVSFICTKTDDILESEIANSLEIKDEIQDCWDLIGDLRSRRNEVKKQIGDLKAQKNNFRDQLDRLESKLDEWEDLRDKVERGKVAYPPSEGNHKRKRKGSSDEEDSQASHMQDQETPLTGDVVEEELANLKVQKRDARKSKKGLDEQISASKKEIGDLDEEEKAIHSEIKARCIQGRNKYSKTALKRDFAMGIKELDQDSALEQDEDTFDPDQELRDYDEVARSLPVFCVSARAYQKLSGRLEKDAIQIGGFLSKNDTEIPQLQEHAQKLTEGGRVSTARRFLNGLSQLLNSMKLWTACNTRVAVSIQDQKADEVYLRAQFLDLSNEFEAAVADCHSSLRVTLEEQLYNLFDRLIPNASGSALATATGWGLSRFQGGLYWGTYKAACRRLGAWHGRTGLKDFNADLFEPISRSMAGNWERTFQRRIPADLETFMRTVKDIIQAFHSDVVANVRSAAANPVGLNMLNQQIRMHVASLQVHPSFISDKVTDAQRDASRGFTPVIAAAMETAYDSCAEEEGAGTFARMKRTMESHVTTARNTMFREACDAVIEQLDAMCVSIEHDLSAFVRNFLSTLERDYITTLIGEDPAALATVPLAERVLRNELRPILAEADARFAGLWEPASGARYLP
ncbi:hypothetical protein Daus18300_008756 [Diaporthe australafricana]|uniref:Tat pathway signal sequence n=1 Tax=Diaporthe australafricana TaxID=127596 RepID=A0ABR3WGY8_9PEZI